MAHPEGEDKVSELTLAIVIFHVQLSSVMAMTLIYPLAIVVFQAFK